MGIFGAKAVKAVNPKVAADAAKEAPKAAATAVKAASSVVTGKVTETVTKVTATVTTTKTAKVSVWIIKLVILRTTVCSYLISIFGLFFPIINSVKAIISSDLEGVREMLTYWTVYSMAMYIEFLLQTFAPYTVSKYPPEIKLLFILWLTLPQFQGAYRIYILILKPYFEQYENRIDSQLSSIAQQVKLKANRHIQVILWQLFFAPNDGIISISMSAAAQSVLSIISDEKAFLTLPDQEPSATENVKPTSAFLDSFSKILEEGLYVLAAICDAGQDASQLDTLTMTTYKCSLAGCGNSLLFQQARASQSGEEDTLIPILEIESICANDANDEVIVLSMSTYDVYMKAESAEDGRTLLAALRIKVMDTRSRVQAAFTRLGRRVVARAARRHALPKDSGGAFKLWAGQLR